MFVEYSCNIPLRYPQYIRKKFSMKLREIFRNNVAGILNLGIFPDCSMNILQNVTRFFSVDQEIQWFSLVDKASPDIR